MPPITALLHTKDDARRLGRALETLLPCAELLVVDHGSADATCRVARTYGARVLAVQEGRMPGDYLNLARHDWIFCIEPGESITEGLQASLFEWTARDGHHVAEGRAFSVCVREQVGNIWHDMAAPETRLVPRGRTRWRGRLPAPEPLDTKLEGELLRFAFP